MDIRHLIEARIESRKADLKALEGRHDMFMSGQRAEILKELMWLDFVLRRVGGVPW